MADGNGSDNTRQRLDSLEQMDKLLLRAQVLHQDALEQNQKATARHEAWLEEHHLLHDRLAREAAERGRQLDERIAKLVSSMGEFISRMPAR